jgi:flavin-dependent dehydrogenase
MSRTGWGFRTVTHNTDVFVIGGGPAGLAAAIAARQKGFAVTVADGSEPPIDKPCGEGLMPDATAALRSLGVHLTASEGCALRGIKFLDAHSSVTSVFPMGAGVGVRRTILHAKMLERAAALGVNFLWRTPVVGISGHGIQLAGGGSAKARWIVGADGGQSRVRRWAGLDGSKRHDSRFACRAHFSVAPWLDVVEIYWADNAQAYVTPVSATEVCVVIACEDCKVELRSALRQFPELQKKLSTVPLSRPHRGAITTMRRLSKVCSGNVALIGDASGSVDAITGEGLSLSFQQASALAEAMAAGDLSLYQSAHRSLARRPTFMARLLLLLDGRPRLRRRILSAFAQHPELFSRLTSIHVGETSPAHLVTTGAMLGWHFLAA